MVVLVVHDTGCPQRGNMPHSDAAKRLSDAHNLHRVAGGLDVVGQWIASKLDDGSCDSTLYPTRAEAIRHQLHESLCTYVQIQPSSMSVCAAEVMLKIARRLYDAGMRMTDPEDSKREPIRRLTWEDQLDMAAGRPQKGLEWPSE